MQESTLVSLSLPLSETLDFLLSEHFPPAVIPSGAEGWRTVCGAQRTLLCPPERAAFAEVVPCTLKTGCDPSTSVGMTAGARRPVTVHHDLINDEPGKENRQSLSEVVCPAY